MPPVDKWRVTGSLRKYIKIFAYTHGGGGSECPVHTMMIDMGIMHNGYSWFWGFSPEWLNDYCRVIPPHQTRGWELKPRMHPGSCHCSSGCI